MEGKDVTNGAVDVAVCDGFTGNVMLKTAEGVQELIFNLVREAAMSKLHYRLAGAVLRPALRAAARRLDYAEVGGAPLIGVRGAVYIGHGRSNEKAIANGIRTAAEASSGELLSRLQAAVATAPAPPAPAPAPRHPGGGVMLAVTGGTLVTPHRERPGATVLVEGGDHRRQRPGRGDLRARRDSHPGRL